VREINQLSIHQWLRSAIPDSPQPTSPIGFLFLKLPPPPCAVLLVTGKPMETIDFPIATMGLFWFQFSLKPIHGWLAGNSPNK